MGSQAATEVVEERFVLNPGDRFNEWTIERQILSVGYSGLNRAWKVHCSFCRFARVLYESSLVHGYVPRCPNNCGH